MSKDEDPRDKTIRDGIEQLISSFQYFFRGSDEISISARPESDSNPDIWVILLERESKDKPLSMLVFFDFDEKKAKAICYQLGLFLVAFGYEIIVDDKVLDPSGKDEETIEKIHNFFSTYNSLSTDFGIKSEKEAILVATSEDDSVSLLSLPSDNKTNLMLLEKCISLFLASKDNTITLAEKTTLNIYGCASYSESPE